MGYHLTIEQAVNALKSMENGYTPEECLEGFHFVFADWHAGMKFLGVSRLS